MTTEIVLAIMTLTLSVISTIWSFFRIYAKRKAERSLEHILTQKFDKRLLLQWEEISERRPAEAQMKEYQQIMTIIGQASKELKQGERELIMEALYQPSLKGRQDYAWKIIQGLARQSVSD